MTIADIDDLNAAFEEADSAAETLTYRDAHGRDWITYGDENGYRWGWTVPIEGDKFTVPARLDYMDPWLFAFPLRVFSRATSADAGAS